VRIGPNARSTCWCMLLVLSLGLGAQAQYPPRGPYPTGRPPVGYPPGTYPPGPYPPDQSPRTGSPGRLPPGAIPEGPSSTSLPNPESKRVRRTGEPAKAKDPDAVVMFQGMLRKLTKQHLLLETKDYGFVRFNLATDTVFEQKEGDALTASTLHPGDTLSVEVRCGDLDTVLRAILVEAGSAEVRLLTASKTEPSTIQTPSSLDLPDEELEDSVSASKASEERPVLRRGRPTAYTAEGKRAEWDGSDLEAPTDSLPLHPAVIAARETLFALAENSPEYMMREFTTRDQSAGTPPDWKRAEALTVDVVVRDGAEEFRNARINGKAIDEAPYEPGHSPAVEFSGIVSDLLSPDTGALFDQAREESMAGRGVDVFRFRIPKSRSPWKLQRGGLSETPAHEGTVWIDRATHRVLHIEKQAVGLSPGSAVSEAKRILEFGFVRLNQRQLTLPLHGESVLCGSAGCVREITDFHNYRTVDTVAGRE
jgi:hypothetical protein